MLKILGVALIAGGFGLILSCKWSAEFHERWNRKFAWTRWATGPRAMLASKVSNLVVGIALIAFGCLLLLGVLG